ncbi:MULTISPECIES: class I SAM-dependent rRNA methyltransferase [unclassified Carboxylicivirga]|uniref:class I SAM-dependent rRNA methyltransferase n=1 Tax=Carboxylicivirga TaxID=1628153 RepID=UPI003D35971F
MTEVIEERPQLVLKQGKEQSLNRYHPWVFSGAVKGVKGPELQEGDIVEVRDSMDNFLALGHYIIGSIAVRILSFEQLPINYSFWKSRIQKAYELRKAVGLIDNKNTNAFRLVHGEGDYLPGLIIDYYNGTAVVQMHTVGMYLEKDNIAKALQEVLGDRLQSIFNKSEGTMPYKADIEAVNGYIYGKSSEKIALENGLQFKVDWERGQKTGFFVDQRENRSLIEHYSKDREVLNMFCYTGGFSFYAMRGGAKSVHSVDSSERAIQITKENVDLNFPDDTRHEAFAVDAFKYLNKIKNKYDLIILDPPAFAKHVNVVKNALQGYRRLNAKALEQIRPGGILFTFSCSQVISKEQFRTMVFSAAARADRKVRILQQLTQPADHPVDIYHPEGEYLKGLVVYVE